MTVKTIQRSYAGGVITPEMFARFDTVKNQTGLAEAVNMVILPHGPAANRTGFEYTLEVKDSSALTCLLPFVYSTTQSMVLEFGNNYIRFHTAGGTLLETVKNITTFSQANPGVIHSVAHGYNTGEWVFILGCGGGFTSLNFRFYKVVRIGADDYSLTDLAGVAINTSTFAAYGGTGSSARVYEIATTYATADLFALHFTQSNDVLTITHPSYQQRELRRLAATNWTLTALAFAPTIAAPASTAAVATVAAGATTNYFYQSTAIAAGTLEESYASPASAAAFNLLTTAGNYNTVTPAAVAGAVRYNIYRLLNGLYGFVGQTDGSALIDNNITPDTTRTPPLADNVMNAANDYPSGVGYFQQRRWFVGTNNDPQRSFATRSGTEGNMSYSIPANDADRLSFRIASRQANTIRHIVPLEDVILLTSGGVWVVSSVSGATITGASLDPRQKGRIGASNVQPVITDQSILYPYDRGGRVREFAFRGDVNGGYSGRDISIMAPHYFDKYTIAQTAFTQAPHPTAWFVRSDGVLLGITYVPEHQVEAWHSHTTQGFFESICSVPEGSEDVLYAVIRRTVNGRTVRYVERLHTRLFTTLADAFFLDAAVFYNSTPATTFTGLQHLEGKTVNALADGAVVRNLVVANGSVTLDQAASKVCIGLQITAQLKTLPLALEIEALGQGSEKNINKVYLRVSESSSIFAGPTYATVKQVKQRTSEPYGSPPNLVTDEKSVVVSPDWNSSGQVCVQQIDPLPLTLLSMALEVARGS